MAKKLYLHYGPMNSSKTASLIMTHFNYPKYKEHKATHDDFAQKVTELRALHDQKVLQASQLLNILREWLINHICSTDKQYSDFFIKALKR